ncbi:hypothetical protein UCD39_03110 [Nitrospirillum sp. BR 11752]|uniref:hypothetical protein n=1 Tax=Nitrospirillum sp. BR 11752 TaxID=3104293 RepID=UPI002E9E10DD|nr:hypothetical protein [Nitrospirillum sp. BR 11752]
MIQTDQAARKQELASIIDGIVTAYENRTASTPLLLRPVISEAEISPVAAAIDALPEYQAVNGRPIYSGTGAPVLTSELLARKALGWAYGGVPQAIDLLFRVLSTETTKAIQRAAVWGVAVNEDVEILPGFRFVPFDNLPETSFKEHIRNAAQELADGAVWWSRRQFALPGAVLVKEIDKFPYLINDDTAFNLVDEFRETARVISRVIESSILGTSLVTAYWMEYEDSSIDLSRSENFFIWDFAEVAPWVGNNTAIEINRIAEQVAYFCRLEEAWRSHLSLASERFRLSLCRHDLSNRALDLAISFEIALGRDGSGGAISWKATHRAAQMIGGSISERKEIRRKVKSLFDLRHKVAHGSINIGKSSDALSVITEATAVFVKLMGRYFRHGKEPDWDTIELEPTCRE